MKPLFAHKEYENSKSKNLLPLECYQCQNTFFQQKKHISMVLKGKRANCKFCSYSCANKNLEKKQNVQCLLCSKEILRLPKDIKKSKNYFCSKSCAAIYNNTHKTTGNRRSKLEIWIECKLTELYPELHIDFNKKDTINSELDIYIPSLKLAIELNGIFHYEPIYGEHKLEQIKNNDYRKHQACYERGIEILSIDTCQLKHFKEHNAEKYLNIITKIIDSKIGGIITL